MRQEPDPLIRRLQWGAAAWCAALAAGAAALWPGQPGIALGIVGGGLLTAVSFLAIKSSIDGALALMGQPRQPAPDAAGEAPIRRPRGSAILVRAAGRYALLALLAYVMIARLRLHPIGLIVGASALVASAAIEAGRWVSRRR